MSLRNYCELLFVRSQVDLVEKTIHAQQQREGANMMRVSRRTIIKVLGGIAGSLLVPLGRFAAAESGSVEFSLTIHEPSGKRYIGPVKIVLSSLKDKVVLLFEGKTSEFSAKIQPGNYRLTVSVENYVVPSYTIALAQAEENLAIYLGKKGWPFYRQGKSLVPFEPRENRLAVVFLSSVPDLSEETERLTRLKAIGLEQAPRSSEASESFKGAGGTVWFLRPVDDSKNIFGQSIDHGKPTINFSDVEAIFSKERVRFGLPTYVEDGQIKVLTNRFVVEFPEMTTEGAVKEIVASSAAHVLERLDHATNAWLIAFSNEYNYQYHLNSIEAWITKGTIVHGEPSLSIELVYDCTPQPAPNDSWVPCQTQFKRQQLFEAWDCLAQKFGSGMMRGIPKISIGILDTGVNMAHGDVKVSASAMMPGVAYCYDPVFDQECPNPWLGTDHGMWVYGLIAATSNNSTAISGIAPNTRQIVVKIGSPIAGVSSGMTDTIFYSQTLMWMAGVRTTPPTGINPTHSLGPPAHIINCSHGAIGTPESHIMCKTFYRLAKLGRNGYGTVVVYASGNQGADMTGQTPFANDLNVIAVGCTALNASSEQRLTDSNYGKFLDLCAMGEGAPTLDFDPNANVSTCNGTSPPGVAIGHQTSAAAPMVAGCAALMLTANPKLYWYEVRAILCNYADRPGYGLASADLTDGTWTGNFNNRFGHGRLNFYKAVNAVIAYSGGIPREDHWC